MAEDVMAYVDTDGLVAVYLAAWTERRAAARRRLLEQCWDEGANFSAWTTHVVGLDAMDAHIAAGQRHHPRQCRRVRTSEPYVSGNKVSFTWSLVELGVRVRAACSDLAARAADADVVVVTHVSPIKAAVAWALGTGDEVTWRMYVAVASITRIRVTDRGPVLVSFNEVSHLTR